MLCAGKGDLQVSGTILRECGRCDQKQGKKHTNAE
jgi:hypothetical protein